MKEKALIEALLFTSDKPLSLDVLANLSRISNRKKLKTLIEEIIKEYEKEEHGILVVETPSGYEFRVKPEYAELAKNVAPTSELTNGMLKTLALVILKENCLQSEIVKIQGNKAYHYLEFLERKGFVRREKKGRTRLIKITQEVEKYFGKPLEEIKKEIVKYEER
ncbi:MAG: SMC-Scp complex subunit ScpB [Candidatus Aenigmarchaeota archaeon]|nr:SMC-Scp complex subunit ScpB [Candidatus Aenigmarchaeota archaeon]MDW8149741.1 SMC-Scp complex subunit ScpB [Candidatus Aenigmarchaeota archaeon]